jgi:hypothetical protein
LPITGLRELACQSISLSKDFSLLKIRYVNFFRRLFYAIAKPLSEKEVDVASLLIEDLQSESEEELNIDTELLFIYKTYRWRELDRT